MRPPESRRLNLMFLFAVLQKRENGSRERRSVFKRSSVFVFSQSEYDRANQHPTRRKGAGATGRVNSAFHLPLNDATYELTSFHLLSETDASVFVVSVVSLDLCVAANGVT